MSNTAISKTTAILIGSRVWCSALQAQQTIIRGKITDARTKLPPSQLSPHPSISFNVPL